VLKILFPNRWVIRKTFCPKRSGLSFFHQIRAIDIIETKKKKVPDWNIEVYHPEVNSDEHQAIIFRPKNGLTIFSSDCDFAQKIVSDCTSRIIIDDLTSRIESPKRDPFV
jgi:hypothetical protein